MERLTSVKAPRSGALVHVACFALLVAGSGTLARVLSGAGSILTFPLTREFHFAGDGYEVFNAELLLVYLIAVLGLSLMANCGLVSLGHSAMFGVGAYALALSMRHGWSFWVGLLVAAAVSGLLGIPLGYPALRLGHWTLAMVTFAYTLVFHDLVEGWKSQTGGTDGLLNIRRPEGAFAKGGYYWLLVTCVVVAYAAVHNLTRSPVGRRARAVATSEIAASSIAIDNRTTKLTTFMAGSVFAGLAGALYAGLVGYITPLAFTSDLSLLFLLMVLLGGSHSLAGPVVGAVLLFRIPLEVARITPKAGDWTLIIYGSILLVSVYLFPRGIVSGWWRLRARLRRDRGSRSDDGATPSLDTVVTGFDAEPVRPLGVSDVHLALGGNRVLQGIDLELAHGTVHGLIGPNGSGKTTLLNVVSGFLHPDKGVVRLRDQSLQGVRPEKRASRGLARTFQTPLLFDSLSCRENVMVALDRESRRRSVAYLFRWPTARRAERETYEVASGLLASVGLANRADDAAGDLPPGERRLLELARIVALKPRVLLMDEPAAGLNETEIENLIDAIVALRSKGIAVLLVEHHVDLVRRVCDVLTVIDAGSVIAHGAPDDVLRRPVVVSTYLGMSAVPSRETAQVEPAGDAS